MHQTSVGPRNTPVKARSSRAVRNDDDGLTTIPSPRARVSLWIHYITLKLGGNLKSEYPPVVRGRYRSTMVASHTIESIKWSSIVSFDAIHTMIPAMSRVFKMSP